MNDEDKAEERGDSLRMVQRQEEANFERRCIRYGEELPMRMSPRFRAHMCLLLARLQPRKSKSMIASGRANTGTPRTWGAALLSHRA